MVPGKPISTHAMPQKLARQGITVRSARNGSVVALAADLPTAVIADLLGIHVNTAVRWVNFARRDWPTTALHEPRTRRKRAEGGDR